ncbi:hypothetical protein [Chitinophaga sp. YR627]
MPFFFPSQNSDSWDWLLSKGFTVIQTDRPAMLLAYLKKKRLHK